MTPDQWQQIKTVLDDVLELPPEQREPVLDHKCQGNNWLKTEVQAYLALEMQSSNSGNPLSTNNQSATLIHPESDASQTAFPKVENLKPGFVLDTKYEILRFLGKGGMGYVFLAQHCGLGTQVAIKILKPRFSSDQSTRLRFHREAQMAAHIDHPNVVRVQDFGIEDRLCYLVMEYLEGETLRTRLKTRKIESPHGLLELVTQVCAALKAIHAQNIIHRDLKPDNIFFHRKADQEVVKILDFGVAKTEFSFDQEELTYSGLIVGTPAYMSPEQCRGETLTPASDIYALGVILFEILSGKKLFEVTHPINVLYAHLNVAPPDLKVVAPIVSEPLSQTVMQMLRKNPAERFQSVVEFLTAFQSSLEATGSFALPTFESGAIFVGNFETQEQQNRKTPVPRLAVTTPNLNQRSVSSKLIKLVPLPVRWLALGLILGIGIWGLWNWGSFNTAIKPQSTSATSSAAIAPTGPERMLNNGFEDGLDQAPGPNGWLMAYLPETFSFVTFTWDSTVKHTGKRSVLISVSPDHPAKPGVMYSWHQPVQFPIEPGIPYLLSGYIKTENATRSAGLFLQCWHKDMNQSVVIYSTETFTPVVGNTDWTYVQIQVVAPPETAMVTVRCYLHGPAPGGAKAWFDDISLKRL